MNLPARFATPEYAPLLEKARRIRLFTCDVDGVLTDGRIYFNDEGVETRAFHATDGLGIKLLIAAGIHVVWITGSRAMAIEHRAKVLGVSRVIRNVADKITPWHELRNSLGLAPECCAHIGDDAPDLPLIEASGFGITVPAAPDEIKAKADYVTHAAGGLGAVREVCDLILAAQSVRFDATMQRSA